MPLIKSATEIENALNKVDSSETKYSGMSYEAGVEEALMWVLGDLPDEEFEYGKR